MFQGKGATAFLLKPRDLGKEPADNLGTTLLRATAPAQIPTNIIIINGNIVIPAIYYY